MKREESKKTLSYNERIHIFENVFSRVFFAILLLFFKILNSIEAKGLILETLEQVEIITMNYCIYLENIDHSSKLQLIWKIANSAETTLSFETATTEHLATMKVSFRLKYYKLLQTGSQRITELRVR